MQGLRPLRRSLPIISLACCASFGCYEGGASRDEGGDEGWGDSAPTSGAQSSASGDVSSTSDAGGEAEGEAGSDTGPDEDEPSTAPSPFSTDLEPSCGPVPPSRPLVHQAGVLHCAGQAADEFSAYYDLLGGAQKPTLHMSYHGFRYFGWDAHTWAALLREELEQYPEFLIPQVGLSMTADGQPELHYEGLVASGELDADIDKLGDALEELARPVLLRIGYEFNGPWNGYDPVAYREAFIRITTALRARNLEVATVWNFSPDGAANFLDYYPGDDVVDWWSLNLFEPANLSSAATTAFLSTAQQHGKPVLVGEATPRYVGVQDGQASWNEWFAGFFALISDHPEIRGACYINRDWSAFPQWSTWGDARLQQNATVSSLYADELTHPRYVHGGSESAFRQRLGYADDSAPGEVTGLRVGSANPQQVLWACQDDPSGIASYEVERNGTVAGRAVQGSFIDEDLRPNELVTYRIRATDRAGNPGPHSNPLIYRAPAAFERVLHGNFEQGARRWGLQQYEGASAALSVGADGSITNDAGARVSISGSTGVDYHVQLVHQLKLHGGSRYEIRFTARASAPTTMAVMLQQHAAPYASYATTTVALSPAAETFVLPDVTLDPTVGNIVGKLAFFMGASGSVTIDIDDVSVVESAP